MKINFRKILIEFISSYIMYYTLLVLFDKTGINLSMKQSFWFGGFCFMLLEFSILNEILRKVFNYIANKVFGDGKS